MALVNVYTGAGHLHGLDRVRRTSPRTCGVGRELGNLEAGEPGPSVFVRIQVRRGARGTARSRDTRVRLCYAFGRKKKNRRR